MNKEAVSFVLSFTIFQFKMYSKQDHFILNREHTNGAINNHYKRKHKKAPRPKIKKKKTNTERMVEQHEPNQKPWKKTFENNVPYVKFFLCLNSLTTRF